MNFVNCGNCQHFIVGTTIRINGVDKPHGMVLCGYLQDYKAKIAHLPVSEQVRLLKEAEIKLGIIPKLTREPVRLTYPKVLRICQKFLAVDMT